jgi:hypothetical protein
MDEREFLRKIRLLQESDEKIGLTDFPVKGVDSQKSSVLLEQGDMMAMDDSIQTVEPDEQKEEENKFKDFVSKLVKFNPIKVHPENVEWSGHLIREKIDWNFSLDDTIGCYIHTTELIQLRDETLEVLKKLRGYYDVWSDEWSSRLTGASKEEAEQSEEEVDFDFGDEPAPDMGGTEQGGVPEQGGPADGSGAFGF